MIDIEIHPYKLTQTMEIWTLFMIFAVILYVNPISGTVKIHKQLYQSLPVLGL